MCKLPSDIEAPVDIATVDVKFENNVVLAITIEVREDTKNLIGDANFWKLVVEHAIEKHISDPKHVLDIQ